MTRCICQMKDGYINIPADRMEYNADSNLVLVYRLAQLVAAVDAAVILEIHMSEKGEDE